MPVFTSLADADAWRAVHAPPRKTPQASPKIPAESAKNSAGFPGTTTTAAPKGAAPAGFTLEPDPAGPAATAKSRAAAARALLAKPAPPPPPPPEVIDVASFVAKQADFDALMIEHAERVPQITYGLLVRASGRGEPGAISAATKNWHESAKAAADVREKFIAIQRETRALIPIDDVENVVATELREVGKFLRKLGTRAGPAANPADPVLAVRVIDAAVDELLALFAATVARTRLELDVAKADADAGADADDDNANANASDLPPDSDSDDDATEDPDVAALALSRAAPSSVAAPAIPAAPP